MSARRARMITFFAVVPLVAVVVVVGTSRSSDRSSPPKAPGLTGSRMPSALSGRRAPRIVLRDGRGGQIDTAALRGVPYAVTFLFTRCPDVCPVIGQELRRALEQLGAAAGRMRVIAVSVDPKGDTAEAVRTWVRRQRLPAQFRYGIGSTSELAPVWRAYYSAPQIAGRPETSTHTASVWLIDAAGRWRARYPGGAPIDAGDLVRDLGVLIKEARSEFRAG